MQTIHQITSNKDEWYTSFYSIYSKSFPIYEQRSKEQQTKAFENNNYHLECIIQDITLIAFIAYWEFDEYIYIEHFAVNSELRGKNYGTQTLQQFIQRNTKIVLLEIDPVSDDISEKRLRFYENLEFKVNNYEHFHPAYNPKYPSHKLILLSYKNLVSKDQFSTFQNDMRDIIMK